MSATRALSLPRVHRERSAALAWIPTVGIHPADLAHQASLVWAALYGLVDIDLTVLIRGVGVVLPALKGAVDVDLPHLNGSVHVVLRRCRTAQACQHRGDNERGGLGFWSCHSIHRYGLDFDDVIVQTTRTPTVMTPGVTPST